jgi:hypothetical protein
MQHSYKTRRTYLALDEEAEYLVYKRAMRFNACYASLLFVQYLSPLFVLFVATPYLPDLPLWARLALAPLAVALLWYGPRILEKRLRSIRVAVVQSAMLRYLTKAPIGPNSSLKRTNQSLRD